MIFRKNLRDYRFTMEDGKEKYVYTGPRYVFEGEAGTLALRRAAACALTLLVCLFTFLTGKADPPALRGLAGLVPYLFAILFAGRAVTGAWNVALQRGAMTDNRRLIGPARLERSALYAAAALAATAAVMGRDTLAGALPVWPLALCALAAASAAALFLYVRRNLRVRKAGEE